MDTKIELLNFLIECRDSHKPWAKKTKKHRVPSVGSQNWNINTIKEYQEAINFVRNKLRKKYKEG